MALGLKDLLKAGVHFGHQTHRWNPKMRKYIFAERGGIYLIDLNKTLRELERAQELVRQTILDGKSILFVCTKQQLKAVVRTTAEESGSFYVTERWLGGMLTNFQTIRKNIERLKTLERGVEEGAYEYHTKKERLLLEREREKLDRYLSGIKDMGRLPGLVFVVDAKKEEIAVKEANRLGIPVVAIADTNADPDMLTIAIAGNDDAIRSVALITTAIAETVESARREIPDPTKDEKEAQSYTYSSDAGDVGDGAAAARRKRPRRKPRPEAIAKRLQLADDGGDAKTQKADASPDSDTAEAAPEKAPVAKKAASTTEAKNAEAENAEAKNAEAENADDGTPEPS